jgi:hypothetical protein
MGGAHIDWAAAERAQARAVERQSEELGAIHLGEQRLAGGDRSNQPAGVVVLVLGDLGGLPTVQPRRRDTEPLGGL